ncbi:MAG: hypothetical protein Q8R30_02915 [bacterium]|nr:hypothetical protein [bacterium]
MFRLFTLLLVVLFNIACAQAQTHILQPDNSASRTINGTLAEISIELSGGAGARFFKPSFADVRGDGNKPDTYYRFAEMQMGDTYGITINLRDKSQRVQVGIAVDGRHVISGQQVGSSIELLSTWETSSNYVISQTGNSGPTRIRGWRENNDKVREFVVTTPARSLAGKWHNLTQSGTIVVAVFRERTSEPQITLRGSTSRGLGTGAGQQIESRVTRTTFNPQSVASEIFVIKYETQETLQKIGVNTPTRDKSAPYWPGNTPRPGQDHIKFPKR